MLVSSKIIGLALAIAQGISEDHENSEEALEPLLDGVLHGGLVAH
jgi:hypothetical protein